MSWVERAVERSAAVQRSRERIAQQVRQMLDAARTLIQTKGDEFTTQELAAEAGVALQTFYRYFSSKDELLLAVIGDAMADACERWAKTAGELPDPLARLRFYLTVTLERLSGDAKDASATRFIVSTHWRLHRQFPKELAEAEKPFVDLLRGEVAAAIEAGLLNPPDPEWDSWFLAALVRSVYHYYAYVAHTDEELDDVKEQLWRFCLTALGGHKQTGLVVLDDPVGGERFLGVEERLDVMQDQILEHAADERDVDLADARQPQRAARGGVDEEVVPAEMAGPMRDRCAVGALRAVADMVVGIEVLRAGDGHVDRHEVPRDRRQVLPRQFLDEDDVGAMLGRGVLRDLGLRRQEPVGIHQRLPILLVREVLVDLLRGRVERDGVVHATTHGINGNRQVRCSPLSTPW